jgi:hypothetical protein
VTTRAIAAIILALVTAGCSGDDTSTASAGSSESAVERFASIVDSHEDAWRENVATIHDICADSNAANRCVTAHRTAGEQATSLHRELTAAHDPQCQADTQCGSYVGEVPAAIATLVAGTETAAREYSASFKAWDQTGCVSPLNWHCGPDEQLAMSTALGDLTRQFDAWNERTNR